jgi:hypothetical protein
LDLDFQCHMLWSFCFMFNEVGVPFVDIGGSFYHHCLNFLFMINLHTALQLPNDTLMNFYRCLLNIPKSCPSSSSFNTTYSTKATIWTRIMKKSLTMVNNFNKENNHLSLNTHTQKTMTYDVGNPSPGLEQAQQCGRVKLLNGMDGYYWALHHIYWPLIIQNDVYSIYYSQACPCGHLY